MAANQVSRHPKGKVVSAPGVVREGMFGPTSPATVEERLAERMLRDYGRHPRGR